jgi:uncharacterized membrane protein
MYFHQLLVALLAMIPLTESRGSIPIGITVLNLSPLSAYLFSLLGNMVPLVLLFLFLPQFITWLAKSNPHIHAILERYFFRLSKRHEVALNAYGALFLFVFVAIPHPGGGVYSASILATLFRMKRSVAIPAIVCGMIVSGLIVLSVTEAARKIL